MEIWVMPVLYLVFGSLTPIKKSLSLTIEILDYICATFNEVYVKTKLSKF